MRTELRIASKRLRELAPAEYNPRRKLQRGDRRYEKLRKSLSDFGLVEPLIWNERTGRLVSGHQRLRVLLDEGVETAQVSVVDLPEARERALVVAMNNPEIGGEWDQALLRQVLDELDAEGILEMSGFERYDLDLWDAAAEARGIVEEAERATRPTTEVDLIFTINSVSGYCCAAVGCGFKYGFQSGRALVCGNARTDPRRVHRVCFIDNDYFDYDHQKHLEMVARWKPKYATVRDVMNPRQCERDGIEYYELDRILRWAEEVSAAGAEEVIVIPKYDCLDEIPGEYVIGYSVPSSHGGSEIPIERVEGRRIHLLGGSPLRQWAYTQKAAGQVVSVDNNYILKTARWGRWFDAGQMRERSATDLGLSPGRTLTAALVLSLANVAQLFGSPDLDHAALMEAGEPRAHVHDPEAVGAAG